MSILKINASNKAVKGSQLLIIGIKGNKQKFMKKIIISFLIVSNFLLTSCRTIGKTYIKNDEIINKAVKNQIKSTTKTLGDINIDDYLTPKALDELTKKAEAIISLKVNKSVSLDIIHKDLKDISNKYNLSLSDEEINKISFKLYRKIKNNKYRYKNSCEYNEKNCE